MERVANFGVDQGSDDPETRSDVNTSETSYIESSWEGFCIPLMRNQEPDSVPTCPGSSFSFSESFSFSLTSASFDLERVCDFSGRVARGPPRHMSEKWPFVWYFEHCLSKAGQFFRRSFNLDECPDFPQLPHLELSLGWEFRTSCLPLCLLR